MTSSSESDKKNCTCKAICWTSLLVILFTVNFVFTGVVFMYQRSLQRDLAATSEMNKKLVAILSEPEGERAKRSALSSATPSSHLAVDVGSVFLSAIKQMCKPEGAVCIPGAKGEAGLPGRDGQPGRDGLPGDDGQSGRDGLPGDDGQPGRDGLPGTTGRDGPMGLRGPPGTKGEKGERGYPGSKGEKGDTGLPTELPDPTGIPDAIGTDIPDTIGTNIPDAMGTDIPDAIGTEIPDGSEVPDATGSEVPDATGTEIPDAIEIPDTTEIPNLTELPTELSTPCHSYNHQVLSDTWRKVSSGVGSHCDRDSHGFQPGWYAFNASIGGSMPETCPPVNHCGTNAVGWLKGTHPTSVGQNRSETVCFHWHDRCCNWQVTVDIINCGGYYVYNLPNEPGGCYLAYCSNA